MVFTLVILSGVYASINLRFSSDSSNIGLANQSKLDKYNLINNKFAVPPQNTILILESTNNWTTVEELSIMDEISTELMEMKAIYNVISIANLKIPKKSLVGINHSLFLDISKPKKIKEIIEHRNAYADILDKFISPNNRFALLFIELDSNSVEPINLAPIQEKYGKYKFFSANRKLFDQQFSSTIKKETWFISITAFCLIVLTFYYLVRSFKSLLLISIVIAFNLSFSIITMVLLNIEFSMQMIALPCIIIILTITDVLHILYYQTIIKTDVTTNFELRKRLVEKLNWTLFLTSFSNSVSFIIYLIVSENTVLSELAIIVIISIFAAYISSRYLVLNYMTIQSQWIKINALDSILSKIQSFKEQIYKKKNGVIIGFTLVSTLLIGTLIQRFKIDMNQSSYITQKDKTPTLDILSHNFFGNTQLEVIFNFSSINEKWKKEHLEKVEQLIGYSNKLFNIKHQSSHLTIIKRYNRFNANGLQNAYRIPNLTSNNYLSQLNQFTTQLGGSQLCSENGLITRLKFGFLEESMFTTRLKTQQLERKIKTLFKNQSVHINGKAFLANKGMFNFSEKYIFGVFLSILFTVFIIIIKFKSIKMGIGMLLVNLIPIVVVILIMHFLHIQLNPLTLFLISVLSGLCLDDSIFLSNKNHLPQNKSYLFPVLITTIVLSVGFLALFVSDFKWLKDFSILLFIGIWVAFLLDIFILPLFLKSNH